MSYVLAFLGFAALIILHEAGHFTAAKTVGMRVERFSLFFGPMLLKTRRGETEYGIGAIPLGGYVKITGMNPNEEIPEEHRARAYYNQPVWKRVFVISAGPAVNILIAFGIIWVLILSNGQVVPSQNVGRGPQGSAADGACTRATCCCPSTGSAAARNNCATRSVPTPVPVPGRRLRGREAGPDRRAAGGQLLTFIVRPRYSGVDGRPELGFSFAAGTHYPSVPGAASAAATGLWSVTKQTVSTIAQVFEPKERKQLSGVVGGYTVTQESFATSPSLALQVLALISLSLGVINLFPFLPLDGGHIFWALAEKVRGRRIPFAVMERAGMIGFVLIILLFFIGLSNDLSTLSGKGFNVR